MSDERLGPLRAVLDAVRESGERGETALDTGLEYTTGEPVRVFVRRRGHRWDFGDRGRAVRLAGKPTGWLAAAERVVAQEGMNVNRAGVIFVPAVEQSCGDLALLALRLGESSHAVFAELIDLAPE